MQSCSGLSDAARKSVAAGERKSECLFCLSLSFLSRGGVPARGKESLQDIKKDFMRVSASACTRVGKKVFLEDPVQKEPSDKQGDVVRSRVGMRFRNILLFPGVGQFMSFLISITSCKMLIEFVVHLCERIACCSECSVLEAQTLPHEL